MVKQFSVFIIIKFDDEGFGSTELAEKAHLFSKLYG